jgi:hypothetical protein
MQQPARPTGAADAAPDHGSFSLSQEAIMQKPSSSPRSPSDGQRPGETLPAQGETQQGVPRMPHERDESAASQAAGEPSGRAVGQAGQADLEQGRVDTDTGPALDQAYDKVRQGTGQTEKKFRP